MAQTTEGFAHLMRGALVDVLRDGLYTGQSFIVPIFTKTPERRAWDDAVAWLEARKAAAEEWPWPTTPPSTALVDEHGTLHGIDPDAKVFWTSFRHA